MDINMPTKVSGLSNINILQNVTYMNSKDFWTTSKLKQFERLQK